MKTTNANAVNTTTTTTTTTTTIENDDGKKMVVAITGATGFVGTKLVESLLKDGHEVRVLTRSIKQAKKKLKPELLPKGKLLLIEPTKWAVGVRGATHVVNLAGGTDFDALGRASEAGDYELEGEDDDDGRRRYEAGGGCRVETEGFGYSVGDWVLRDER